MVGAGYSKTMILAIGKLGGKIQMWGIGGCRLKWQKSEGVESRRDTQWMETEYSAYVGGRSRRHGEGELPLLRVIPVY